MPSGPDRLRPPLWFAKGWWTVNTSCSLNGSAWSAVGVAGEREARGAGPRLDRGPVDGRDTGADRRGVLQLAGGRAAVAARGVAVIALLGALDDAVAAGRGRRAGAVGRCDGALRRHAARLVAPEAHEGGAVDVGADGEAHVDLPLRLRDPV